MQRILTIIVTYNGLKWIEKCISSVINSTIHSDILVVDNGSTDGTQEFILSAFPCVRFIQNPDNQGFGAANNIGLRIVRDEGYDYAYLLNQDAYLFPDTLKTLLSSLQTQSDNPSTDHYGILSPIQLNADGRPDGQFAKKCASYLKTQNSEIVEVPFVMAAHWLMTRKAILTVGGFSPTFLQYGEDDNYLHRLHYHKMRCAVVKKASAIHDRASRNKSKERNMKLKCVATIVKTSNPNNFFYFQCLLEVFELIGMTIKNLSFIPLLFIPKFFTKLPEIKKNRKKTFEKAAFL